MAEKQNTPEIRFKGFTDPWEQRKLGDVAAVYDGVHQTPDYQDEGVMFLSVENIATLTSQKFISREAFAKDYPVYPKHGDVLMTRIGDIGTSNVVETDDKLAFYVSLALLKPFDVDSYYLDKSLQSPSAKEELYRRTLHIAFPKKINKNQIAEVMLPIPRSRQEQEQIGALFRDLDSLITLHQRKHDKLCTVKRSMLDKMFPKPGETEPEIRFKGFTDPWEQRKLGGIAPVTMGQSPNGACYTDNPNDAVLVQGNADLKDGWVFPRVWTTEITKTAKAGDLIMSVRAPVGAMGKTAYDVVLGRGVAGIAGNEFLFQALSKKEAEGYWSTVSAGSTFDSINGDELRNTPVDYPRSKPEREAVGSCLSRIDCLITLHQRKLDLLKNTKKSLLDKMFV